MTRAEEITKLLADAESEGYARGYSDAIAAVTAAATAASKAARSVPAPVVEQPNLFFTPTVTRGRPPSKAIDLVRDLVTQRPGMTGVEVYRALAARGTPVLDRTIRSCLRRLRESKAIWQRKKRWYARSNEVELEANGEALRAPPH